MDASLPIYSLCPYRLGKIEERTGCNLRHVADVLDLLIALRVQPPPAH